ncbi:MAG TPA: tetratricopeptide repeat protein [Pyrinomonadaceae bacterium]|jgi:tetratricopeptide (TPR) repeat protein|nr:tetratricopeptide repeat protein [Pyrinomonadaceae bacterium]
MKTQSLRLGRLALLTIMIATLCPIFAQAQSAATTKAQEADALFQSQKWADAAQAYEAITKVEASNGRAWFRLGVALHSLGRYEQAVGAFQKALEISKSPQAMYNLASSYARMNEREQAFEWLKQALNAGFAQVGLLNTDADLANLRGDARFKEILTLADKVTRPCMFSTEHRQFDFWLGEWNVENNGQQAGINNVQSILDGCVIYENWTSARGGTGKSFNFYDTATGKWQQTWVDSAGNVLNLTGEFKDNALRFSGETRAKSGGVTLHRLTFFNLGAERVRQFWEQSTDGGKTWNAVWDGTYTRKK